MKALSLTQPWATLVAIGAKHVETRSWSVSYRGPIAIHASKGFPREAIECCFVSPFNTALKAGGINVPNDLPRGAIVAVATLRGCYPTTNFSASNTSDGHLRISENELAFGDYSPGRYGWAFVNIRKLAEPIQCRGALGLWDVPFDVIAQVIQQLGQ